MRAPRGYDGCTASSPHNYSATRRCTFFQVGTWQINTTDTLERVDNIVNTLDEIMDHMEGFSSAEEAWLSASPKRYASGATSCARPTKAGKAIKRTSSFMVAPTFLTFLTLAP